MFYINEKGERFGEQVFNLLDKNRKKGFIKITDDENKKLVEKLTKEQKTFTIKDDKIVYNDIVKTSDELRIEKISTLQSEKNKLNEYLLDTNRLVMRCLERGLLMAQEYPQEYKKREEVNKRIDEIEKELAK